MSYTVCVDEAYRVDRLEVQIHNIIQRRCRIGKVKPKARAAWPVRIPHQFEPRPYLPKPWGFKA